RAAHARFARVAAASEARPCSALTWGGSVLESAPGSIQESVKGLARHFSGSMLLTFAMHAMGNLYAYIERLPR
ncbi:MAG: hypothetical protein K1X64_12640, partial [Myxococcaceae bacterium]|nr:hypothetical protein [Myxococcaceae bacterium]